MFFFLYLPSATLARWLLCLLWVRNYTLSMTTTIFWLEVSVKTLNCRRKQEALFHFGLKKSLKKMLNGQYCNNFHGDIRPNTHTKTRVSGITKQPLPCTISKNGQDSYETVIWKELVIFNGLISTVEFSDVCWVQVFCLHYKRNYTDTHQKTQLCFHTSSEALTYIH